MTKREKVEKLLRIRGSMVDEQELSSLITQYYNETVEKYGEKETVFEFTKRFRNAYQDYTKKEIELYYNTFTHAELDVLIAYFENPVSSRIEGGVDPYVRKLYQGFSNDVYGIYYEDAECGCCCAEDKKRQDQS
ncbi:hypothetical protein MYX06_02215 [Patescibacteria group bacterium AH-259-L05]|nr:hypothetical protein [Patescibacteria group bacterium AH-259-L05]